MTKATLLSLAFIFGIGLIGVRSSARADNLYAGAFVGPSFVNDSIGTRATFGLRAGFYLNPYFRLGVYGSYANLGTGSASSVFNSLGLHASGTQKRIVAAIEGEIFPMPGIDFFVGGKIGAAFVSYPYVDDGTGANFTQHNATTGFAIAPTAGYLYHMTGDISVGLEASYLIATTSGGSNIDSLDLLGSLTFEF